MMRLALLSLLTLPLIAQSPFRTTRHAGLPSIYVGDKFAAGDLDGDGDIDLFVANDNSPNQLLLNDGSGRFVDATAGRFVMQPDGTPRTPSTSPTSTATATSTS